MVLAKRIIIQCLIFNNSHINFSITEGVSKCTPSVFYAQSPDFHKLGDWKQSSKQDSLACQGRDNRDNFSAVKSQFQFTDSVANNLFIIQTATLFRLRSHIQQIVKYVCFGFIGILKSVRIIL